MQRNTSFITKTEKNVPVANVKLLLSIYKRAESNLKGEKIIAADNIAIEIEKILMSMVTQDEIQNGKIREMLGDKNLNLMGVSGKDEYKVQTVLNILYNMTENDYHQNKANELVKKYKKLEEEIFKVKISDKERDSSKDEQKKLFAQIVQMTSFSNEGFVAVAKSLADIGCDQLKQGLTNFYLEQHDKMEKAATKQANHLVKKYDVAKSDFDADFHKHQAVIKETDSIKENLLSGKTIAGSFPQEMHPLLSQMNAVSREIKELKAPKQDEDDLTFYRNRVLNAYNSLTKERKIKVADKEQTTTDLKIIKKDLSPITRFFENVFHVVSSALIIGAGFTIARAAVSKEFRGHGKFWKPMGYDLSESTKEVEKNIGVTRPKKHR